MRRLALAAVVAIAVAVVIGVATDGGEQEGGALATRTVEAGEVTVKVTPIRIDEAGAQFEVVLDTHSVELGLDVAAGSRLTVGGRDWGAATWSGARAGRPPPRGHAAVLGDRCCRGHGGVVHRRAARAGDGGLGPGGRVMAGYALNKEDYLTRLRRIEGQVRGLQRMIDDDRYCIDVLTQISSVTAALEAVALGLVDEHLRHCVMQAAAAGADERDRKLHEAVAAVERLVHS